MEQFENLIALYNPQIIPQQKNILELHGWLSSHFNIEEFPLTEFSNSFIKQLYFSVANAITNEKLRLKPSNFSLFHIDCYRQIKIVSIMQFCIK